MIPKRWIVTAPGPPGAGDGIADYADRLAHAIGDGASVQVDDGSPWPPSASVAGVLHQYSPSASSARLRRWIDHLTRQHVPVIMTVHEFWPPPNTTLRRAVRRWQLRRRLRRLASRANAVVVTQQVAARELMTTGVLKRMPAVIPVGSNISCVVSDVPRDAGLVIFGQPASYDAAVLKAVDVWRRRQVPPVPLTWISRNEPELVSAWRQVADDRQGVVFAAGLEQSRVSSVLAAATIGVAPYLGGASGRRTTLAAMLAHGVPCVVSDGPAADDWVQQGAIVVASPEPDAFVVAVDDLWRHAGRRAAVSGAARELYHRQLTWETIASAYRALMNRAQERHS